MSEPRLLLLETSSRSGWAALAEGDRLLGIQRLDEARRHARDLAPAVAGLLARASWQPRDLSAVVVGRGPGSYTGLRVGMMSAKAFAYATGCALLGIPVEFEQLSVIADAQQDNVYAQDFVRSGDRWQPSSELAIMEVVYWLGGLDFERVFITGPGLDRWENLVPNVISRAAPNLREPRPEDVLRLGLRRFLAGERDEVFSLEPLYLRPSSAEQQWQTRRDRAK
jgi:tRNA threonylcarbamoyladenosine biosynthesis protein TsaB